MSCAEDDLEIVIAHRDALLRQVEGLAGSLGEAMEELRKSKEERDAIGQQVETLMRERDAARGDPNKPAIVVGLGGKYHLVGVADDIPPTKWKPCTEADAKEVAALLTQERDAAIAAKENAERERDALRDCDMAHKLEESRQAFASESRLRERFQTGYDIAVHMAAKSQEERDALQARLAAMTALIRRIHDEPGIMLPASFWTLINSALKDAAGDKP